MKYLVMETHPAYAVVLDEQGRYLKTANLHYEVGDTVGEIVELRLPVQKSLVLHKPLTGLIAVAACLCLVFFGYYTPNYTAYGTLRIQINPDVQMTISQTERVLELVGLNPDGMDLIEGYSFAGKSRDTATGELVDRAIEMGYLSGGDTISITVNSKDAKWQDKEETHVRQQLEERYGESVVIRLGTPTPPLEDDVQVIVPVTPPQTSTPSQAPSASSGITDYNDTDYGANNDGITDYNDTDYGANNDGITDYNDIDYGSNSDGATDYDDNNVNDDDSNNSDYSSDNDDNNDDNDDDNDD